MNWIEGIVIAIISFLILRELLEKNEKTKEKVIKWFKGKDNDE